ncbi:MAG: hypothetical protein LBQ73_05245 [Tannerellaceae bacterium]|jgi:hypothetical protein|nr:hypothetical protein [Tannerellaceae bacterium]
MKHFILVFWGVFLASCGYNPQQMDSAYGSNPGEFAVDKPMYKDIIPSGYELARISKIEVYESDSKVWAVTFVFGPLSVGYKNLPKGFVKELKLHKGDVVAVNKEYDIKKLPLYLKKVPPAPKREDYHPEEIGEAYGGKSLDEMVPDWGRYEFSPTVTHARIVKVSWYPDLSNGTAGYYLKGPDGYAPHFELFSFEALEKRWKLGDIIRIEFELDFRNNREKPRPEKAEQQILIPAAQWQEFIRGGKADGPLLKNAAGRTIEQSMEHGSFVYSDFY